MKLSLHLAHLCLPGVFLLAAFGCTSASGELVFQSGFESGTQLVSRGENGADLIGKDESLPEKSDWVHDLDEHPDVGRFSLQYQEGDSSRRYAAIIPEPGNPANHVLQFWVQDVGRVQTQKGRVQANLYGGTNGWGEFCQSVRVYLPEDMGALRAYPGRIKWLTISEFWNNIWWVRDEPYGFRATLGIGKPTEEEGDLHFILHGQDGNMQESGKNKPNTLWNAVSEVTVPVGKWFTMQYYYCDGDAETGRFYMTIQPDGGEMQVVFDVTGYTHNSKDPNSDGITHYNPMKAYTSRSLIHFMRDQGKTIEFYWDDFKVWKNKRPEGMPTR